jgi:hypothetical protein
MLTQGVEDTQPVIEEAVAPFLATYSNPELGELVLEFEDGALYFDVGEFRMEVRAQAGDEDAGEAGADSQPGDYEYVIFDAPFTGLPLQLARAEDDQPQVRLGQGIEEYLFTLSE